MIRKLLATTAIATLLSTGAYAQSTPAPADDSAQPAEEMQPADGSAAAPADDSAAQEDDAAAQPDATAQDTQAQPAEETAQDTEAKPAEETAQDTEMEPAEDTDTAQSATPGSDTDMAASDLPEVEGHLASNLIGSSVYNGTSDDAENIGEVNDVVIGKDGKAQFVVIGVGGFLGIGEKDVAIEYATLEWAERDGDMWLVVETTAEQLEQQQAFDRTAYDPEAKASEEMAAEQQNMAPAGTAGTTAPQGGAVVTAPATTGEAETEDTASAEQPTAEPEAEGEDMAAAESTEAPADEEETAVVTEAPADDAESTETAEAPAEDQSAEQTAQAPADDAASTDQTQTAAIDRSTLQEANIEGIRAEQFVGTTVYGANEETIGEIGDVILTEDGKVDAVLVDVGGFLGMGEKEVAIGMDNLQFMQDGDGNLYLYTEFSQEQLEAQPAYDEATYAENRDTMRLTVEN